MFRRVILLLLCLSLSSVSWAQIKQAIRYEHDMKMSDEDYFIIPLNNEGLILIRDLERYEGFKK